MEWDAYYAIVMQKLRQQKQKKKGVGKLKSRTRSNWMLHFRIPIDFRSTNTLIFAICIDVGFVGRNVFDNDIIFIPDSTLTPQPAAQSNQIKLNFIEWFKTKLRQKHFPNFCVNAICILHSGNLFGVELARVKKIMISSLEMCLQNNRIYCTKTYTESEKAVKVLYRFICLVEIHGFR